MRRAHAVCQAVPMALPLRRLAVRISHLEPRIKVSWAQNTWMKSDLKGLPNLGPQLHRNLEMCACSSPSISFARCPKPQMSMRSTEGTILQEQMSLAHQSCQSCCLPVDFG